MAKPISIETKAVNISEFDKLPKRLYSTDTPPLKRKFDIAEKWYIADGELSFIDELTNQSFIASTGDVIILPQNSAFNKMQFTQPTYIKQYIDDANERNRISTNIKVNYLIIQTILEIIDQFEDFTSVPYDNSDFLFESAREGTLYDFSDNWQLVDEFIQNYVDRTGISENVWYGKRRLKTGLRFNKPDWDSSLSIDFIDLSSGTIQEQQQNYNEIINNPLDLYQAGISVQQHSIYTLKNLFIFVARIIKEEEMVLVNKVFPDDIELRQPRNSGVHLNKKGMPPYILYGNELVTIIKHLFWVNSVGLENRLKLKDL